MLNHDKILKLITIIGENGTVKLGGINEITHWAFGMVPIDEYSKSASYETNSVYGYGHTRYLKNVICALRGEERPKTNGREGLRSLELLVAIYRAARDGKRVPLPLDY